MDAESVGAEDKKGKILKKFKKMKAKKDSKSRSRRDMPWDLEEIPRKEASITDRMSYLQRQNRRTWFPSIGDKEIADTVVWHNTINIKNHLGQSWLMPPLTYIPNQKRECCLPKARIHRFSYHTSSLTNVEMFPSFGHLVLSSSLDSTIRIWSMLGDRQCIQTYMGHTQGVKDIAFKHDGLRFASCCFGKRLKLWDTDKGKVISSMLLDSVPFQLLMNKSAGSEEEAIVSLQDGRIVQYDFRQSGQRPAIAYMPRKTENMTPMTTISYTPDYKHFLGANESGEVSMWSVGSESPIHTLGETWIKPVTNIVTHPKEPKALCQTFGNEILILNTANKLSVERGRSFQGHTVNGTPCRMSISPDGSFVTSGDESGTLFIWDWDTTALMKTFKAHDETIIKAQWSPYDPSQIVTASYDNTMALFD